MFLCPVPETVTPITVYLTRVCVHGTRLLRAPRDGGLGLPSGESWDQEACVVCTNQATCRTLRGGQRVRAITCPHLTRRELGHMDPDPTGGCLGHGLGRTGQAVAALTKSLSVQPRCARCCGVVGLPTLAICRMCGRGGGSGSARASASPRPGVSAPQEPECGKQQSLAGGRSPMSPHMS